MLLLLPPSEAKRDGGSGPPVGRRPRLSTPSLAAARAALIAAIRAAHAADRDGLSAGLKLPPGLARAALAANRRVATAATMPALDRYAGVVFAGLDPAGLTRAARTRADESVLVFSGLWGVVRGADLVPAYRVPAAGKVAGVGGLATYWRAPLTAVLPEVIGADPVLDLRSTDYLSMWRPTGAQRDQVVTVRVLAEKGTGSRRTVAPVSYHAKLVKGLVARHVVSDRTRHRDAMAALDGAAEALGLRLEDTSTAAQRSVDLVGRYP